MQINVNTDDHITNNEDFTEKVCQKLEHKLGAFGDLITNAYVFFGDENASRGGARDKVCTVEVRLRGLQPQVVSHHSETLSEALTGSLSKMRRMVAQAKAKRDLLS